MLGIQNARAFKFAAAIVAVLAVAACSKNQDPNAGAGLAGGAPGSRAAPGSVEEFAQSVGDRVFFETDSSELTPTAQATLDKQSQWLNQYGRYRIVVEGHADERGTREYNIGLGERRAQAVRRALALQGVAESRLATVSYGEERPAMGGEGEEAFAKNRRVELVYGTN